MPGKRDAHERLPELIAAAVHVFTREGYPLARMSDVAAEMGLSETPYQTENGRGEGLGGLEGSHPSQWEKSTNPTTSSHQTTARRAARSSGRNGCQRFTCSSSHS
jgi:hypothetical protein